jgi:glutathione S-transferase
MQLHYAPGACSLAPHIIAREAGADLTLVKVDIQASHRTEDGRDFRTINPRGYVPALVLDDGSLHTEASVLVQYLADLAPESGLMPPAGSAARLEVQEWLAFIATELHKTFSPWLWSKETAQSTQATALARIAARFADVDNALANRSYLTGETFTAADAYLFTIANWANFLSIDLAPYPNLVAFMKRVAARPAVREALIAEGLAK